MRGCPETTQKFRDATSPTLSTESVLIVEKMYAHDRCNAGICDIPGAVISVDMDEEVKMALRGRLVELMVNIAPQI